MTKSELYNILKQTGYKVSSVRFNSAIIPPYVCYEVENIRGVYADGVTIGEITSYIVCLFKSKTDLTSPNQLEDVLTNNRISYEKDISYQYVEDENIELICYRFEDYVSKGEK
jgi:phage terminase large subunit-like protein